MVANIQIPDPSTLNWRTPYAEAIITAPRQTVWDVLTNFAAYDEWNSFTYDVKVEDFAVGEVFSFTVNLDGNERDQPELIVLIDEPYAVAWRYPFKQNIWLAPIRYQVLTELDTGQTHYQTWERFDGLFAPVLRVLGIIKQVQTGFDTVALDLKRRCESL